MRPQHRRFRLVECLAIALEHEHVEHHEQVEVQIARTLPFSALGTALDLVASGKAKGRVVLEVG